MDRHPASSGETEGISFDATRPAIPWIGQSVSHYQIQDVLGRGGMGLVYRATDTLLRRPVALKFLAAPLAGDPRAKARFLREAQAASALDHPNIGTIFEIGETSGRDPVPGQPFIAMALYDGETLRQRLERGPLPLAEGLAILGQIAAGLSAAHEAGIVHRDLKPANVMLTRSGQVKILDFGLAKLVAGPKPTDASFTESGHVLGTVAYMSPEQARAHPVDHRTDLWSLGVVAYEMLGRRQPFEAETPMATLSRILMEEPRPLHELRPEVPPWLQGLITRLLSKDPGARPSSGQEVVRALAGSQPEAAEAEKPARRAVAVLGFKNLSGRPDTAWLSVAFSEMLGTELASSEQLRILPGEDVARMKLELSLAEADSFGKDTLLRIRKNLGAELIVLGSYLALGEKSGGKLRVDFRLQDAALGETIASVSETGTEDELFELLSRVGTRLLARCGRPGRGAPIAFELVSRAGLGESPALDAAGVRASLPAGREAARLYMEGLGRLRLLDALHARELLEQAIAAEPEHPLPHWALAEALMDLGYEGRAKREAQTAFELSGDLPRAERLSVEARYRELAGQRVEAIELYRTLWEFFPDRLDYGASLSTAQIRGGKGLEAIATLEAVRKLPAAADDPRLDLHEAWAAQYFSDFKRQEAAASRAAAKGRARGAWLLVGHAKAFEGDALDRIGQLESAQAAYEEARRQFAAAGDRPNEGRAIFGLGWLQYKLGDMARCRRLDQEALEIFRQVGDQNGLASALTSIASGFASQWEYSEASPLFEQALEIYREIGSRHGMARVLGLSADMRRQHGNFLGARAKLEEALAVYREDGNRPGEAYMFNELGIVSAAQGDMDGARLRHAEARALLAGSGARDTLGLCLTRMALEGLGPRGELVEALRLYDEALEITRSVSALSQVAKILMYSGPLLLARGDLSAARARYTESLAIAQELGERLIIASNRVYLAQLSIEEGRPAEAERPLSKAVEEMQAAGWLNGVARGSMLLAEAHLAQGRRDEAASAIGRATALLERNVYRGKRFSAAVLAARIRAAYGHPQDRDRAASDLEAPLAEAEKAGFVLPQLEARLALGELELSTGSRDAGRARLEALEREAADRGFGLIARKAAAARNEQGP